MNKKTARLLAEALEKTLENVGMSATEMAEAILGIQTPRTQKKYLRAGYVGYFEHQFAQQPEPDKKQLAQLLAMIEGMRSTPYKMRSLMKQKLKELPHPPGGAPRKIRPEDEKLVCAEVIALRSEYDTRDAIRQVARKHRISERTLYRIWGKYHPKKKKRVLVPNST